MYIRANMTAYLDSAAGSLDSITAEPLRVWKVTGTVEAIEAFRAAVGGVALPDVDITGVLDMAVVAQKVTEKKGEVVDLKVKLDKATVELTDLQAILTPVETVAEETVVATIDKALPVGG